MIAVLFEGLHTNHYFDGFYEVDPLTSSVTLIQSKRKNILIDTGTPKFFPLLKEKLVEYGLTPKDIHYIFNTHFHLDHTGCDAFFPNAEVRIGRSSLDYKTGRARIYTDEQRIEYPAGVKMLFTPGHTVDHASYLYKESGVQYICAGDAVREDIIRRQRIPRIHLPEKFVSSMKMIFEKADIIIPGHGRVIQGELKKELYALVCSPWELPVG